MRRSHKLVSTGVIERRRERDNGVALSSGKAPIGRLRSPSDYGLKNLCIYMSRYKQKNVSYFSKKRSIVLQRAVKRGDCPQVYTVL